jgi:hypothetical protein
MYPMIYIPFLPSLQISQSPSDFSLPSWDPNILCALHVEMMSFGTQIHLDHFPLLACLLTLMAITSLFFFFLTR